MAKQKKKTKSKKYLSPLLCKSVMAFLVAFLILGLITPDRLTSEVENRKLAQLPIFSWQALWNGSYGSDLEAWFEDQFVGRDLSFQGNYLIRKGLGQRLLNGQYLGKKTLIGALEVPDREIYQANIKAVDDFALKSNLPTSLMVIPPAEMVLQNKLPFLAPVPDLNPYFDSLATSLQFATNIELRGVLEAHQNEELFFRTDHHWSTKGAGYGAAALVAFCQGELDFEKYSYPVISTNFEGTAASYAGSVGLQDSVVAAIYQELPEYEVLFEDGKVQDSVYVQEALKQKNQYAYFLGENQGLIEIHTQGNTNRHLMLIKDSYANIMVQYLLPFYDSILVVDPRYYLGDLNALVQQNPLTHIAFVLSYQSFRNPIELSHFSERLADIPQEMEES